ncbi:MAG: GH25 family lysozyme, partial [Candidatus Dormibacteria bacterium]
MLTVTRRRVIVLAIFISAMAGALAGARLVAAASPMYGIDVSSFQGSINWNAVASGGISFAFIRAGEGTSSPDGNFQQNWNGAMSAGIKAGAYLY